MCKYREVFGQLDDPDWLLMDQCGDRYSEFAKSAINAS